MRYTYWISQAIAVGGEAVAAGLYMQFWFPHVPVWIWALGFCLMLLYFNSRSVDNFGTVESWLALIKVAAIVLFIILGLASDRRHRRIRPSACTTSRGCPGGFLPKGVAGLWMAVTVGIFSFNGIEVIAVTSGETEEPAGRDSRGAAHHGVAAVSLLRACRGRHRDDRSHGRKPASRSSRKARSSPSSQHSGVRDAAGIMNFVVISAALSSMNTDVYLCSRMLFSLSRGGYAPRRLGTLSSERQSGSRRSWSRGSAC